jgi:hypothetical protein
MKRSLHVLLVSSVSLCFLACSKGGSPSATGQAAQETRPVPALDQVQEGSLSVAGGMLYLTDYEREHNRDILSIDAMPTSHSVEIDGSRKVLMQPVLTEDFASGGSGGILRLADSGKLEDVHLAQARAAIEAKGVTPSPARVRALTQEDSEKQVETAGFTPGSLWILSVHDRGEFILAIELGKGFEPSPEVYRLAKIRYKVLEFHPEP